MKRPTSFTFAALFALAGVGCTTILGLDGDYLERAAGESPSSTGEATAPTLPSDTTDPSPAGDDGGPSTTNDASTMLDATSDGTSSPPKPPSCGRVCRPWPTMAARILAGKHPVGPT